MANKNRTPSVAFALCIALTLVGCEKGDTAQSEPPEPVTKPEAGDLDGELEPDDRPQGIEEAGSEPVLSATVFENTVQENMQDVLDCYSEAVSANAKLQGKLVADFKFDGDGKVTGIEAAGGSTLKDDGLQQCIVSKAANWDFPKPPQGATNHLFPFELAPG